MTLRRLLLVVLGGTLGTAMRLAFALWTPDAGGFPLATFTVNILGALLIGVLAARLPGGSDLRVFLGTGILGGFTTYSAFAVDTVQLWAQSPLLAALYAFLTLLLGVTAAAIGMRVARRKGAR
ncbi:fluoride efflux transporter CrcB [Microbacterium shaanxiense]